MYSSRRWGVSNPSNGLSSSSHISWKLSDKTIASFLLDWRKFDTYLFKRRTEFLKRSAVPSTTSFMTGFGSLFFSFSCNRNKAACFFPAIISCIFLLCWNGGFIRNVIESVIIFRNVIIILGWIRLLHMNILFQTQIHKSCQRALQVCCHSQIVTKLQVYFSENFPCF